MCFRVQPLGMRLVMVPAVWDRLLCLQGHAAATFAASGCGVLLLLLLLGSHHGCRLLAQAFAAHFLLAAHSDARLLDCAFGSVCALGGSTRVMRLARSPAHATCVPARVLKSCPRTSPPALSTQQAPCIVLFFMCGMTVRAMVTVWRAFSWCCLREHWRAQRKGCEGPSLHWRLPCAAAACCSARFLVCCRA